MDELKTLTPEKRKSWQMGSSSGGKRGKTEVWYDWSGILYNNTKADEALINKVIEQFNQKVWPTLRRAADGPPPDTHECLWNRTNITMTSAELREIKSEYELFQKEGGLQVLSVALKYIFDARLKDSEGAVCISGSIRARDESDGERNYLFKVDRENCIKIKPWDPIPLSGPCRGIISTQDFLFVEVDLDAKTNEGEWVPLIKDAFNVYDFVNCDGSDQLKSLGMLGKNGIGYLKAAYFSDAAEAALEIGMASEDMHGFSGRITAKYVRPNGAAKLARLSEEEIVLFHGDLSFREKEKKVLPVLVVPNSWQVAVKVQLWQHGRSVGSCAETFSPSEDETSWKPDFGEGPVIDATLYWACLYWK